MISRGVFFLIVLTGCVTAPLMQQGNFDQVAVGSPISNVEAVYGQPYDVRQLPNGFEEHVYIQRIALGRSAVEEMEFVFVVNQGVVVGKDCKQGGTSNFQFSQ